MENQSYKKLLNLIQCSIVDSYEEHGKLTDEAVKALAQKISDKYEEKDEKFATSAKKLHIDIREHTIKELFNILYSAVIMRGHIDFNTLQKIAADFAIDLTEQV